MRGETEIGVGSDSLNETPDMEAGASIESKLPEPCSSKPEKQKVSPYYHPSGKLLLLKEIHKGV